MKKKQEAFAKFLIVVAQIASGGVAASIFQKDNARFDTIVIGIVAVVVFAAMGILLTPKD